MIVLLDSENADRDITVSVTVLTHTPSATEAVLCQAYIALGDGVKNLDGTGGNFSLIVTVGGQTIQPSPQTITCSTAVRTGFWSTQFPVPANAQVIIKVLSPNAADIDVDVTAYLFDTAPMTISSGGVKLSSDGLDNINIDSTGGTLEITKAIEAVVAASCGRLSFNAQSGVALFRGRDGTTTILQVTITGKNRTTSTIS